LIYQSQNLQQPAKINYKIYQNLDGFYVEYPEWKEVDLVNLENVSSKEMIELSKPNIITMINDSGGAQLTISKKVYDSNTNIENVINDLEESKRQLIPNFKILDKKINNNQINIESSFQLQGFKMLSFSKGFLIRGPEESNIFYNVDISIIKDKLDNYRPIVEHILNSAKIKNIIIFQPLENVVVKSPFLVRGRARVIDGFVNLRLKDGEGKILFEANEMIQAPDAGVMGDFQKEINFKTDKNNGVLEVFWFSPKNNSELDKVSMPLKFFK